MKKHIYLSLTILCVAFIYSNSLMATHISSTQSTVVLNLIQDAAELVGVSPKMITEHMVRKIAHFCEFALFGLLLSATIQLWYGNIKAHLYMILFLGLFIPISDEFLQLFIAGRTGLVQDVLLDFCGFLVGVVVYIGFCSVSKRLQE